MTVENGYCDVPSLRNQFDDGGAKLNNASLEKAITASSRAIDRYCGRRFWLDTGVADRTYVVEEASRLVVDDIGSRTGVVVKTGTDGTTFPTTLTLGVDYILEPRNADKFATSTFDAFAFWEIRRLTGFFIGSPYRRPTVQVTAKFGWSAIPPEVTSACLLKAASLFKRKDAPFGVAGFGEFGVVRIGRQDPDVIDLLTPYKIPVG